MLLLLLLFLLLLSVVDVLLFLLLVISLQFGSFCLFYYFCCIILYRTQFLVGTRVLCVLFMARPCECLPCAVVAALFCQKISLCFSLFCFFFSFPCFAYSVSFFASLSVLFCVLFLALLHLSSAAGQFHAGWASVCNSCFA